MPEPRYWLLKSEPEEFSIHDLAAAPDQTACWDGVRNYQARNFLRDQMQPGDKVLYYHSNAEPPAVAGIAVVTKAGYPDATAQQRGHAHYDESATPANPIWFMVDIRFEEAFAAPLCLPTLRTLPGLEKMVLLQRGSRLSVQPVTAAEFETVVAAARAQSPGNTAAPAAKSSSAKNGPAKKKAAPAKKTAGKQAKPATKPSARRPS